MKQSLIQFPRPKKITNEQNPGTHFMQTNTYSAKEAWSHRGGNMRGQASNMRQPPTDHYGFDGNFRRDAMTAIGMDGSNNAHMLNGLPVPMGM